MAENKKKDPREALLYKTKNGFADLAADEAAVMEELSAKYRAFLDAGKTERDCVSYAVKEAEKHGFKPYFRGMVLKAGDKVYYNNRSKAVFFAALGKKPLDCGVHIVASHIDSPRLDLKTRPLYEDREIAYFKTHYYGGIKKYQWPSIPLELRGVVALADGSVIPVSIGKDPSDPVFTITDILPHLSQEQYKKTLAEAVPAETLNVLLGSIPAKDYEEADKVKLHILELLNEKYDIREEDLASAELSLVPAFNAREIGLDRSMIGAYGHDDRVCAYASFAALLRSPAPELTAVAALMDKEEIGSEGVSGMQSAAFDTFMADLCDSQGVKLRVCYENSLCLSADVCAALDPSFSDVSDVRNAAQLNQGVGISKYTGSRGKSGASDASAELVARLRGLFNAGGVAWQMAPMGKVDLGGGGTVAMYMAKRNIDTIDAGTPVLSMHSPFEVISKFDFYMTFKACKAVFEEKA